MTEVQTATTEGVLSERHNQVANKVREHWRNLAQQDKNDATDAEDIADRQVAAIMEAKTEDEIWDADTGGTIQMRDAIGLEVQINDFRFLFGNDPGKATRSGTYISCDATVLGGPADLLRKLGAMPGTEVVLQTGAELVISKLTALRHAGAIPARAIILGKETNSGNTVLRLGRAPVHTVTATTV